MGREAPCDPRHLANVLREGDLVTGEPSALGERMLGRVEELGHDDLARVRWYGQAEFGGDCWEPRTALRRVVVADRAPAAWSLEEVRRCRT